MTGPSEAHLRALKAVAMADGVFHDLERSFLGAVQGLVLKTDFDLDALEPIDSATLVAAIPQGERASLLDQCIVTALIDGEASPAEEAKLEELATALGVRTAPLRELRHLVHHHLLLFRIDVLRRSFIGQRVRDFVLRRGVRGLASVARGLHGVAHEPTANRYIRLAGLPKGTLGRDYFEFTRDNEFSLPGEEGGPPEPIVFHDCVHVLAQYGTSTLEETQIAAFQAGMLRRDSTFGLLFVLAQFHLGVQITPVSKAQRLTIDPPLLLDAFLRGKRVNRDLCTDWEPWDDFGRPTEELRRAYSIGPR